MFFVVNGWSTTVYNASNCLHCSSDNIIIYNNEELSLIFSNQKNKLIDIDKEIGLSCRRRMYTACELFIECDQDFSVYEIEVFSETDNKPFLKAKTDRQRFPVTQLEENKCYMARGRGCIEDYEIYTKWSKECCFYSLKSSLKLKNTKFYYFFVNFYRFRTFNIFRR